MTPSEYWEKRQQWRKEIKALENKIWQAYRQAMNTQPPARLRLAQQSDITVGMTLWHKNETPCWTIVTLVEADGYLDQDGHFRSLYNSWVEEVTKS